MGRHRLARAVQWAALIVVLCSVSCTTDYVTGKRTFSLVSESKEMALGKEADPQIVAEYGLYDDKDLATLVNDIGQSLAKVSHRPQLTYTFRVVDSPIVNAFALPGGYVYMTRGILAHFNTQDGLAGVLGHEIGHVVARHSAEQMSRQQLAGLGLGIGSLFSETFANYAGVAGVGLNLLLLNYSRDQESESDMLGVEYSTRNGYDSHGMADFFKTLDRMSEESGQSLPGFLSTHPDPGDRYVRVNRLTDEWQQKIDYKPLHITRYEYLQQIDGIVYGNDPRQGYVEDQMFYHPSLRFQFPTPSGWDLVNSASTVMMIDAEKKAAIRLTLTDSDSPQKAADDFILNSEASVRRRDTDTVHGFSAVVVESRVKGNGGDVWFLSYFIEKDENIYVFHGFTTSDLYSNYVLSFSRVMTGFEEATDPAVLNKQPVRLRIKRAAKSGELASVLRDLGMEEDLLSELALLNGLRLEDPVNSGDWLKVVGE